MPVENNGSIVTLTHENGSTADIYLYGATVTSWKQGGQERLFVSSKAAMDGSKAIRGGIPIVFPVFGAPPSSPPEYAALKQHGFARNLTWTLDSTVMDRPEGVSVRFKAPALPSSIDFKHSFDLIYVVTLSKHELSTDLHVRNTGDEDFKFQSLLHTYLAVPSAKDLKVSGLEKGQKYKDKTRGMNDFEWEGGDLTINKEVDSVFHKVPSQLLKLDYGDGTGLEVKFKGFEDTTIWNPQEETGSNIADMEDKGWEKYICIEPGYVREFKTLAPGERFIGQQVLSVF